MISYNVLLTHGKSVGYDYMKEVYQLYDKYYLVDFDNSEFEPVISEFEMPSYETLSELGYRVSYFPLDGSEHIRLDGLTFKVKQTAPAKLEIALV